MLILRSILLLLCSLSLLACSSQEGEKSVASSPPNLLFILVDDMGFADAGYLGSDINTPNIDNLAAQGMVVERGYAYPICSPTRAALMSGRNPLNFAIDGPMENDAMLSSELKLMPEYFREAGYQTWMIGKWHLGMGTKDAMPHRRGFDDFYGSLGGFIDFYTHVYFGGLDWQQNGQTLREEGHATDLLTVKALDKIKGFKGDKPFFMYLSYNAPHTPLQTVPNPKYDYSEIDSADRRVYADMTSHLDEGIGQVLRALDEQGLRENTIVVFMSDNGGNLEAGADNGLLKQGKASAYEGGVRVPMLVRWPAGLTKNQTFKYPVFTQDWLPTLLQATNIKYNVSEFDGRSMLSSMLEQQNNIDQRQVIVGTAKEKAVYQWPWKLLVERSGDHKLFNLETDEFENEDLLSQYPDLAAKLFEPLQALPILPSKAAKGPPPESLFRDSSGNFDYAIRKPETREPWADAAK